MNIETKCGVDISVDDEDFAILNQFRWYIHKDGEPIANIKIKGTTFRVKMKLILKNTVRSEKDIYYIDGNPLNNSKVNLSFTKSTFLLHDDYAEMISPCNRYSVKIDLGMVGFVSLCNWTYREIGYVFTMIDKERVHLHRFLLGVSSDSELNVDHINRDESDNRISNLRVCSISQNNSNKGKVEITNASSIYKGLSWDKNRHCWRVRVTKDGIEAYYGEFVDELAGASAYNYYARKIHGEFCSVNSIKEMDKNTFEKYKYLNKNKSHTKYTGVTYRAKKNKWVSTFKYNGSTIHVGTFQTEKEAAMAYNNYIVNNGINRKLNAWDGETLS